MGVKRYLLDTGTMGYFVNHRHGVDTHALDVSRKGAKIGTCLPVIAELYFGAEFSDTRDENLKKLRRALTGVVCWPFDLTAAEEYGRIAADLKRHGRIVGQNDIQIAAIAKTIGNCVIVTADTDFAAIPGLAVENWAS
jgi:tRNA(fMet)-specific endonuclease VapC